ncbi:hypothetical protein [Streptomyces siamensis]|uniref:Uncharacterized protein n=1 Tax=Streptomyces siamensis TaxID=1274986 RepID=A0ABP9JCV6_9ACTN
MDLPRRPRRRAELPKPRIELSRPGVTDLPGLTVDVPVYVNETRVLLHAEKVIARMTPPLTLEDVNRETAHLAITFHTIRAGEDAVVVLTRPLNPGGGAEPLVPPAPSGQARTQPVYDAASALLTAAHGDVDAAFLQAVHARLKSDDGLAAGAARCVIGGVLIHMMPTSVIGKTVTMLTDAVRGMREKAERQKELEDLEAAKDFAQIQAINAGIRHPELDELLPDFSSVGLPTDAPGGPRSSLDIIEEDGLDDGLDRGLDLGW